MRPNEMIEYAMGAFVLPALRCIGGKYIIRSFVREKEEGTCYEASIGVEQPPIDSLFFFVQLSVYFFQIVQAFSVFIISFTHLLHSDRADIVYWHILFAEASLGSVSYTHLTLPTKA